MTDLTPRQILDAMQRGMEETWREIDRGEIRRDGRLDWPDGSAQVKEKVTSKGRRPAINDMTVREILDAMARALDTIARRFARQKLNQSSGPPSHRSIE